MADYDNRTSQPQPTVGREGKAPKPDIRGSSNPGAATGGGATVVRTNPRLVRSNP